MWADVILAAERNHLLRLFAWAGLSVIAATAIATLLVARRVTSPLLRQFAIQTAVWGTLVALYAAVEWHGLHLRDVAGAARLERAVWLSIGFDVGFAGMGVTLAAAGYAFGRRMSAVGAGAGIVVQALALLLLDLHFAALVSR